MTRTAAASGGACIALGVVLALGAGENPVAYSDGPPPAHTGGFGERTCTACHADAAVNASGGDLEIDGLPASFTPGERYVLRVRLRDGAMTRAGFQLSARFADGGDAGRQAGALRASDDLTQITTAAGVQYAAQSKQGTHLAESGAAAWVIEWHAPADARGPVVFHAAANAANGDDSQLGDAIYTDSTVTQPPDC